MFSAQMTFDLFNLRSSSAEMTAAAPAAAAGYSGEMSCRGLVHGPSKASDSNGR